MNNVGTNLNVADFNRVAQASASRVQSRANQSLAPKSAAKPAVSDKSTPTSSQPTGQSSATDSFSNVLSNVNSSKENSSKENLQSSKSASDATADSTNSSATLPNNGSPAANLSSPNISAPKDNVSAEPTSIPVGFAGPAKNDKDAGQVDESKIQTQADVQSARQMAMQVFLDRMQKEVGVSPDKLVEAFSKLSVQDLAEAPEDTADKLIGQLGLDAKNSKKAAGLYGDMLGMMAAAGMAQYLANNNQQAQFRVLDKDQANLQTLRSNISDMSDKFFRTGQFAPQQKQQTDEDQIQDPNGQVVVPEGMQSVGNDRLSQAKAAAALGGMNAANTAAQVSSNDEIAMAAAKANAAQSNPSVLDTLKAAQKGDAGQTAAAQPNSQIMDTASIAAAAAALNAFAAKANQTNEAAEEADPTEAPTNKLNTLSADATGSAGAAVGATASGKLLSADHAAAGDSKNKDAKDGESDLQGLQVNNNTHQPKGADGKPFVVNTNSASQAELQNNVKEIISQAQFLASKGGGEMKMKLAPEGLGELSLKVKMVNGQLNVEMVTANDAAKKILEKGLSELKDNLAMHKIHLDGIKIDTPKDLAGQMNQQRQEMENGFQQKFLGDFRERNNASRHEMFEFGTPSVPSSQTRDRAGNSTYASQSKRKDARRLDLVA